MSPFDLQPLIEELDTQKIKEKKRLVWKALKKTVAKSPIKHYLLTVCTLGLHLFYLRNKIKTSLANQLIDRKVRYFANLQDTIESMREMLDTKDPRENICAIYQKLLLGKVDENTKSPTFRSIFSSSDLFLSIVSPIRHEEVLFILLNDEKSKPVKIWKVIKQTMRNSQARYIDRINRYYWILHRECNLSKDEINQRLFQTKTHKENPASLTKLKGLSLAFHEVLRSVERTK